jgi:hypothetical protein
MKYTYDYIVSRIGDKGYLDLVAVLHTLGFKNIHEVPDIIWATAVALYEENMFKDAA